MNPIGSPVNSHLLQHADYSSTHFVCESSITKNPFTTGHDMRCLYYVQLLSKVGMVGGILGLAGPIDRLCNSKHMANIKYLIKGLSFSRLQNLEMNAANLKN